MARRHGHRQAHKLEGWRREVSARVKYRPMSCGNRNAIRVSNNRGALQSITCGGAASKAGNRTIASMLLGLGERSRPTPATNKRNKAAPPVGQRHHRKRLAKFVLFWLNISPIAGGGPSYLASAQMRRLSRARVVAYSCSCGRRPNKQR